MISISICKRLFIYPKALGAKQAGTGRSERDPALPSVTVISRIMSYI